MNQLNQAPSPQPAGRIVVEVEATAEMPRRAVIASMAGVMAAMLMAALDQTIVGTAMPRIIADLHGFDHYAGVITAYMVASTAAVPIVGKLSDIYGRKLFLLVGVVGFVAASALCGAAESMTQLIICRGLQGIGAGCTQAMAFTTIADLFPPARRGRVTGMMGAVFGLASVIGPAVGGFLTDGPGWRYVFYVNVPIGAAAFAILFFFFPARLTPPRAEEPRIDYLGALVLIMAVVPLLLALSWGGRDYAWDSPVTVGLLATGLAMTPLFLRIEQRAAAPIIPLALFRQRVVWTSMAASALVAMCMFGTTLFIPLFIQIVIGSSATKSGAVMMPMTLALVASSMITGQLITRTGRYRIMAIVGVSLTALGMLLLGQMDVDTGYAAVVRNMIIMGVGLGATMPVFTLAVQNVVEGRVIGAATSTVQFVRSVGGALGAAIFGSVLANRFVSAFHKALPPDLASKILPEQLARLDNPQLLMQQGAARQLDDSFSMFGDQAPQMAAAVRLALRTGLATSLTEIFLLGFVLLVVATVITILLRDVPLRQSNRAAVGITPTE